MEIYKVLIDIRKLLSSGRLQIHDIEEEGIGDLLEALVKTDLRVLRTYKQLVDLSVDISNMRPGTRLEELKNVLNYKKYEELRDDLLYLPRVSHDTNIFENTKNKMEIIYMDNPEIFEDLMEKNGLVNTINKLVQKYNIPKKENQNA